MKLYDSQSVSSTIILIGISNSKVNISNSLPKTNNQKTAEAMSQSSKTFNPVSLDHSNTKYHRIFQLAMLYFKLNTFESSFSSPNYSKFPEKNSQENF
jgi:hypothetical protein